MSTAPIDEGVLRKIRKCLALASSDVPGEAEAAMRQAHKLMSAYGVDQGTLVRSEIGEAKAASTRGRAPARWENDLAWTCCRAFGATIFWTGGPRGGWKKEHNGNFVFVGPKNSIDLVVYAYTVLSRQVIKARSAYIAQHSRYGDTRQAKAAEGDAYAEAYVSKLGRKVHAVAVPGPQAEAMKALVDERTALGKVSKSHVHGAGSLHAMVQGALDGEEAQFYAAARGPEELKKLERSKS